MTLRFRPRVEVLENRALLSAFAANHTADGGPGWLRQVILTSSAATRAALPIDFAVQTQGTDRRVVVDVAGQSIPLGRQFPHSGLNDAKLLLGAGGGVFNDRDALVFNLASQPRAISATKFGGQSGLAVVDPDANELTRIADFQLADQLFWAGPHDQHLFARRRGPGHGLRVLERGHAGALGRRFERREPDLHRDWRIPGRMELAFSALTGGQGQSHAAPAGGRSAGLVALGLGVDTALPLSTPESSNTTARLVPLHESSLALVATVLAFTNEAHGNELMVELGQTDVRTGANFLPGEPVSLGQHQSQRVREEGAERASREQTGDSTGAVANPVRSSTMTWKRFVIGLDEALDSFRREHQGRISVRHDQSPGNDQGVPRPQAGSFCRDEPTSGRSGPELSAGDLGHESNGSETPTGEADDIDQTDASLPWSRPR